ncbi:MAG TPA: menaquinone biosynthesis protein [Bacillota bacterium]|nr:menaquinone biosynthesis protein [Bacillota bacterium]
MSRLRLGQVDHINCLPVYHAIEEGLLPLKVELVKGSPVYLNRLFLEGKLDITPVSSIEFARNADFCYILPEISISADGRVENILFFSKVPVTELDGKKISLTESSATSAALLKVLFDHYYHVDVQFETSGSDLQGMLEKTDGALLIGDDAMQAKVRERGIRCHVTDLGQAWKQLTGEKMVYAVWVVRKEYAESNPDEVSLVSKFLVESKNIGLSQVPSLVNKAKKRSGLPKHVIAGYFEAFRYDFDENCRRALLMFYDYAYKSGLIDERVKLRVWGEPL